MIHLHRFVFPASLALLAAMAFAAEPRLGKDWPQFLGPMRNGTYAGNDLIDALPEGGPKVVWKMEVGEGWATPVIEDGKLLIFHRVKDDAVLDCLDAATGKPIWSSKYPTPYVDGFGFDAGPRATPAISDGRVFTFGAEGVLRAVELATGKEVWSVDTVKEYKAQNGFFGLACSPVVLGDKVIATVGGAGDNIVIAFDVKTGRRLWGSTTSMNKPAEAGYSSPGIAEIGGQPYVLAITRQGLDVMKPDSGQMVCRVPFRSREHASVNAAAPLVVGNEVFLSASYGTGAKLLKFDPANMAKPQEVWANDDSMSSHYATSVVKDGILYGFHGRQEQGPDFRCVEWATGKVRWSQEAFGAGTVTLAGDKLLILTDKGVLTMAAAAPDGFKELGKAQILGAETRAYPSIANGFFYARGKDKLVCLDLRKAR